MRNKKIVYVLVSTPEDYFCEMAILSVMCAAKYSHSCTIELVMDSKTKLGLSGYRSNILNLVDVTHVIDVDGNNNAMISRQLKTRLRSYITGDYVYVDIDAVPIVDLSELFDIPNDIAMCFDHNLPPEKFIFAPYEREIFDKLNWPLPERYFNSGVMFVRDNQRVRDFFEKWHELWGKNAQLGLHKDQPPMHEAIRQTGISVYAMEPSWNILVGMQTGRGGKTPKVYHYSTIRFLERDDTYFHRIVKSMKKSHQVDWNLIQKVIDRKYPWTNEKSLKLHLQLGNYLMLPVVLFRKVFQR
jgi:hypothetical protein